MKRNLFVVYSDGREDVYPFAGGESLFGADPSCNYGIQAEGVAAHHLMFSDGTDGTFVINLQEADTVRLNGSPLDGRRRFELGDEVEVGSVRVRLQPAAKEGENLADSPDGVAEVAPSALRAGHAGWWGYRKMLEVVAPFVSPGEAETAEKVHRAGHRTLLECLLVVFALFVTAWILEMHSRFLPAEICRCAVDYFSLFSVLVLTLRYRVRCAGRLLVLFGILDYWQYPPEVTWVDYFGGWGTGTLTLLLCPFVYLYGWGIDVGAGCLFQKRRSRSAWCYLLLVASVGAGCWLEFLLENKLGTQSPISPVWSLPLLAVAGTFPLWGRFVPRKWEDKHLDVAFVAEQAAWRMWRRWLARALAVLAIGTPLLYLLISLGMSERIAWQESGDLVLSMEEDGEPQAWYWIDRGRYLTKADLVSESIYRVPFSVLLEADPESGSEAFESDSDSGNRESDSPGLDDKVAEIRDSIWARSELIRVRRFIERNGIDPDDSTAVTSFLESDAGQEALEGFDQEEARLSETGEELCQKIAAVQLDATNALRFAELQTLLAPYRPTWHDGEGELDVQLGSSENLFFFLEVSRNRETYASGPGQLLHHAQISIGVSRQSEADTQRWMVQNDALVVPCLVLLVFGGLLLWKRGADSPLGFWLGISLAVSAFFPFDLIGNSADTSFGRMLHYPLWHWAVQSPLGGLVAGWIATVRSFGELAKYVSYLSQSVLFVFLCWPRAPTDRHGRWRRWFVFIGKAVLSFGIAVATSFVVSYFVDSILAVRLAAIAVLSSFGAFLRRNRRFDTEAPELGWMFFAFWAFLEIAMLLPVLPDVDALVPAAWLEPIPRTGGYFTLVGVFAGLSAIIGGYLFLRMCLKHNFLAVLTPNGFTFALFSFSIPIIAEFCNPLVGKVFASSFLHSERGEAIVTVALIILVMRPLWNALDRLSRRLSVRNLVRVESEINETLETILDQSVDIDVRDEVYARLAELGMEEYAFFARSSQNSFDMILAHNWTGGADSFQMSTYLRTCLGNSPHVVDLNRLAQEYELFFQSFELYRIGQQIHASCLLPICLGKSVRAILVTPDVRNGRPLPSADAFMENVNTLGLATVESMGRVPQP